MSNNLYIKTKDGTNNYISKLKYERATIRYALVPKALAMRFNENSIKYWINELNNPKYKLENEFIVEKEID